MKANIWRIVGYAGFHDYDGKEDNNIDRLVPMPSFLGKEAVVKIMADHYNSRVVALSAEFQRVVEIEDGENPE